MNIIEKYFSGKNVRSGKRDLIIGVVSFIILFSLSFILSESIVDFMCKVVIMMLLAMSLNIMLGFGGMRPLGHAIYFGIGAYIYIIMVVKVGLPLGLAILVTLVVSAISALGIGYICLKKGDDLAFAFLNMGINILLWTMIQKTQAVGGDTGITGPVRFEIFSSTRATYILCLIVVAICITLIYLLLKSPFATILKGSRENDERLLFLGINTKNVRLLAYVIAGTFAAIGGILYTFRNMGAYPTVIASNTSLEGLIMCLIGGMYSFFGPAIGAVIVTFVSTQIPIYTKYYQMILGVIVVLCVLFLQGGLLRGSKARHQEGSSIPKEQIKSIK